MKVGELASELGVPASAVLEQCQRFGIEAGWAGAALSPADEVTLRAALLDTGATTSRPAGVEASDLPPTAVGSMPELIDEVTPEPESDPGATAGSTARPGPLQTGGTGSREGPRATDAADPGGPRFDRLARNAAGWLLVALVAFGASNALTNPFAVLALWTGSLVALGFSILDAFRSQRRIGLHPDRYRGRIPAVVTLVLAVAALVGLGVATFVVVRDEPATDAPLATGDLASVQELRWGYQRLVTVASSSWRSPAKPEGSCWRVDEDRGDRTEDRVELGNDRVECTTRHDAQVISVIALQREADVPYPGPDGFVQVAQERCQALADELIASAGERAQGAGLAVEYPDAEAWDGGDHDVACVVRADGGLEGSLTE